MKKIGVFTVILASLTLSIAVSPAIAIGPYGALDDDNPNFLIDAIGAVHNNCGQSLVRIIWTPMPLGRPQSFWSEQRFVAARSGGGRVNNAIAADLQTFTQWNDDMQAYANGEPTVNENKWIFLSPDGSGNQASFGPYGTHGMLWFYFYMSLRTIGLSGPPAAAAASTAAANYPEGRFWQYNLIG